jgi:hypothetical protein
MTALLYDPQGIHIGTKRNRAVSGSARKTADDAGDNPRAAPSDNGDWKILLSFQLVISPLIIRRGSEAAQTSSAAVWSVSVISVMTANRIGNRQLVQERPFV